MTAVDWILLACVAGLGIWAVLSLLRHVIRIAACTIILTAVCVTLIVLCENGWLPDTFADVMSESIVIRWCTANVMPAMDALIELIRAAIAEHDSLIGGNRKGQHL